MQPCKFVFNGLSRADTRKFVEALRNTESGLGRNVVSVPGPSGSINLTVTATTGEEFEFCMDWIEREAYEVLVSCKETVSAAAKRLGMKTRDERDWEARQRADALIARIRESKETIEFVGLKYKCIDAEGIPRSDYEFTGSGLVWLGGKIIERVD